MAHYKRKRSRTKVSHNTTNCMQGWPRYWDIQFHRRPKRRREREHVIQVMKGHDPDNIAWPLGNNKPHQYYW